MTSVLDEVQTKVAQGTPLSADDVQSLWASQDLVRLGLLADEARRRHHGDRATYLRVARVAFDVLPDSVPASAGEVRITGRPGSAAEALASARTVVGMARGTPVSAFSLADLAALTGGGRLLEDFVADLLATGVEAVAEAPLDVTADAEGLMRSVLRAGGRVSRFTHRGGDDVSPLALLSAVRNLQRATGAVQVFAPLPTLVDPAAPSTGFDDVRLVAIARLFLDDVPSIQVDWSVYGPKLAQVSLLFGADDLDSVSPADDATAGRRRSSLEEVLRNIRAASLVPVERDGRFSVRES